MGTLQAVVVSRTNAQGVTKLYPNIVSYRNIKSDDLVEYMLQNSSVSKATAIAAIGALRLVFNNYVLNGHTVRIPQLGLFGVRAKTTAVATFKECGADCVKNLKIYFSPNNTIRNECKAVKFQSIVRDDKTLNIVTE